MAGKNETNEHVTNNDTLYDLSSISVLILAIIGVIGNALTLCAFKYAQIKKKFEFNVRWNCILVYIWNLALVDFISANIMTLMYVIFTFFPSEMNNYFFCAPLISIRDIFVLISAISIACIAVVTLLGVTKNNLWMNFCDKKNRVMLLILLCWVLGFVFYIAKFVKIADEYYNLYDEKTFDCGTFYYELDVSVETLYSEFIVHTVAIAVILVSYAKICIHISSINNDIDNRVESVHGGGDRNTSKIVVLIGLVYIIQCAPYMICRVFFVAQLRTGFSIQFAWPAKISYIIYYTQFFPNIFIYVARNENYRSAYIFWMKSLFYCTQPTENSGSQASKGYGNIKLSKRGIEKSETSV